MLLRSLFVYIESNFHCRSVLYQSIQIYVSHRLRIDKNKTLLLDSRILYLKIRLQQRMNPPFTVLLILVIEYILKLSCCQIKSAPGQQVFARFGAPLL